MYLTLEDKNAFQKQFKVNNSTTDLLDDADDSISH